MDNNGFRFEEVHLELTTACNFRCGFCPLVELQRPAARLTFELAERVLRQCMEEKLTRRATFHVMGEALLHPQCIEVLELCGQLGIATRLVTNGSLYREDKCRRLFHLLDSLDISYRTVDDMELQQAQKKLTFEQYLEKLLAAISLRASMPESSTRLRIRLFISRKTMPSLIKLCERLNVDPQVGTGGANGELKPYQSFNPFPWLTFLRESELDWRNKKNHYKSYFGSCNEFDIGFAVLANGDVTTCCWDAHGENVVGNVAHQPLRAILFSDRAKGFRDSFRRHICPTEKCRRCLARPTLARSAAYQALSLVSLK